MANDSTLPTEPTAHEMGHHVRDYGLFVALFKWGAILSFLTAFIVVVFVL